MAAEVAVYQGKCISDIKAKHAKILTVVFFFLGVRRRDFYENALREGGIGGATREKGIQILGRFITLCRCGEVENRLGVVARREVRNLKEKWVQARRTRAVFEHHNADWLEGEIAVEECGECTRLDDEVEEEREEYEEPRNSDDEGSSDEEGGNDEEAANGEMVVVGRPLVPFDHRSAGGKRKRTKPLVEINSTNELGFATQSKLKKRGDKRKAEELHQHYSMVKRGKKCYFVAASQKIK